MSKVILDIPVQPVKVRVEGEEVTVYKTKGFWKPTFDTPNQILNGTVVSNPLIYWHDIVARGSQVSTEQVQFYIRLVNTAPSNPGEDDNGPSLTHDEYDH